MMALVPPPPSFPTLLRRHNVLLLRRCSSISTNNKMPSHHQLTASSSSPICRRKMGNLSSAYSAYANQPQKQQQSPQQQNQQQLANGGGTAAHATTTATMEVRPPPPPPTSVGNVLPLLANGRYAVGCADIMLADDPPSSPVGADERRSEGIFARIFYPASTSALVDGNSPSSSASGGQFMRWRPDAEYMQGLANYQGMSVAKINFFLDWVVGDKKMPVHWHAPVAPAGGVVDQQQKQRFPIIIFSHGISGSRFVYTTVCASLASHGYVVAALEHRDGSCCWTYSLEPPPPPLSPPPPPSPTAVDQPLTNNNNNGNFAAANGGGNGELAQQNVAATADKQQQQNDEQQQQQATPTPPRTPTPTTTGPTLVKKTFEMRILPHDESEYDIRIDQVKKRVAETVQMQRVFVEMDTNGLVQNDDDKFGRRIVLGQTFDWAQFKDRLELDTCVCMGHSFGAASALSACAQHTALFSACVLLDAWLYPVERRMYPGVVQPVLMMNAKTWQWPRNVRRMQRLLMTTTTTTTTTITTTTHDGASTSTTNCSKTTRVINTDSRMMFTLKDIVHQSFSDFGFLVPGRMARYLGIQGELDPLVTGTAIIEMMLNFLEMHHQQRRLTTTTTTNKTPGEDVQQQQQQNGIDDAANGSDTVVKSNASALDRLRRLVTDKYEHFVVDGTDIEQAKLDEVTDDIEAEREVSEEERKVANDSSVDTTEDNKMVETPTTTMETNMESEGEKGEGKLLDHNMDQQEQHEQLRQQQPQHRQNGTAAPAVDHQQ